MKTSPLVSIVLPTFNGSRYIAQSIQSCLDQTFTDWEMIVVDDGSTDGTPDLVEGFMARDPRIRMIRHGVNKKLPGALNTGFAGAQGTYFTWTSDDNRYRPEALARMVEVLDSHPEIDIVYADHTWIDAEGRAIKTVQVQPPEALVRKACIGLCFLHRRAVFETLNGYDESVFLAEDYDFWLRASAHFRFYPLHHDLYEIRMHEASLTGKYKPQVLRVRERVIRRTVPHLPWVDATGRAVAYLHLTELALLRRAPGMALRYWITALAQRPALVLRRTAAAVSDRWLGQGFTNRLRAALRRFAPRTRYD